MESSKSLKLSAAYDEEPKVPPLELFNLEDRCHAADKAEPNLLPTNDSSVKITQLTLGIGTEITGLQLTELNDAQKGELALLLAERGAVVFREQDFKDIGPEKQKAFGQYLGLLHVHPVGAHVANCLEFHNIYLGTDNLYRAQTKSSRLPSTGYHSDACYEHQTPGITIITLLAVPATGGDTAWLNQTLAYERLSEPLKKLLEGLRAEHSRFPQAERARRDGKFVRREAVLSEHPIVRVHPVTGRKPLFDNPGFTKCISGLKDEESEAILTLSFHHHLAVNGLTGSCEVGRSYCNAM